LGLTLNMDTTTMQDQQQEMPKSLEAFVAASDRPVLVDFWADWCGPCHALAPTISEIAKQYKGRIHVLKVDVDARPRLAARFRVQSIPTMILFSGGEAVWRESGVLPYGAIAQQIDRHLGA